MGMSCFYLCSIAKKQNLYSLLGTNIQSCKFTSNYYNYTVCLLQMDFIRIRLSIKCKTSTFHFFLCGDECSKFKMLFIWKMTILILISYWDFVSF